MLCILFLDILQNKETPVLPVSAVASNDTAMDSSVGRNSRSGKMLPMHIR